MKENIYYPTTKLVFDKNKKCIGTGRLVKTNHSIEVIITRLILTTKKRYETKN